MAREVMRIDFRDQIARNKRRSFFLIIIIFLVFIILGGVIGLAVGMDYFFFIMILAIIISVIYVTISFYNSHKIALASVGAKPADPVKHRMLFHAVENMSLASGLPMPKVYVMDEEQINAFASGRDPKHAVICVTTGALSKLNKQELEGVISHEMSHIGNYDIRFMTLVAIMVGMIAIISQIFLRSLWFGAGGRGGDRGKGRAQIFILLAAILLAILAPIVTWLVQMAISRKREYAADASGVKFTRYPPGLIGALKKIKHDLPIKKGKVSKAVAPLFMSDPFRKDLSNLTATHPPISKRIAILERM